MVLHLLRNTILPFCLFLSFFLSGTVSSLKKEGQKKERQKKEKGEEGRLGGGLLLFHNLNGSSLFVRYQSCFFFVFFFLFFCLCTFRFSF